MGVGIPGFEFQLTAGCLSAGRTFLEPKGAQPAQQGLQGLEAPGANAA